MPVHIIRSINNEILGIIRVSSGRWFLRMYVHMWQCKEKVGQFSVTIYRRVTRSGRLKSFNKATYNTYIFMTVLKLQPLGKSFQEVCKFHVVKSYHVLKTLVFPENTLIRNS